MTQLSHMQGQEERAKGLDLATDTMSQGEAARRNSSGLNTRFT